jgi:hypothetical protein
MTKDETRVQQGKSRCWSGDAVSENGLGYFCVGVELPPLKFPPLHRRILGVFT